MSKSRFDFKKRLRKVIVINAIVSITIATLLLLVLSPLTTMDGGHYFYPWSGITTLAPFLFLVFFTSTYTVIFIRDLLSK